MKPLTCLIAFTMIVFTFNCPAKAQPTNIENVPFDVIPPGTPNGGVFRANGPGSAGETEVIYDSASVATGFFFRPGPVLLGDDTGTTLDNIAGGLLESYSIAVFGSATLIDESQDLDCSDEAAIPYEVATAIWKDSETPPDVHGLGEPLAPIPGTTCQFIGIPKGSVFMLECPTNVVVNGQYWTIASFSSLCGGWIISELPSIGHSAEFAVSSNYAGGNSWFFFSFGGICETDTLCTVFAAQHLGRAAGPDACCNTQTNTCENRFPGLCQGVNEVYTEGVLCNDLPDLCTEAGACCDTLTGQCRAAFEGTCTGIFDEFTPGGDCSAVTCAGGQNIPTVSQWGLLVLTTLLLTGLTIVFGRARRKPFQPA